MSKLLNFVKTRKAGNCWVRHRPMQPDAGMGLCEKCERMVAEEGIEVPDYVRSGSDVLRAPAENSAGAPTGDSAAPTGPTQTGLPFAPQAVPQEAQTGAVDAVEVVDLDKLGQPAPSVLPSKTVAIIQATIEPQKAYLDQLNGLLGMLPLDTQEGLDDAKEILDEAHALAKKLRAFMDHYTGPLKELEKAYRGLIFATVKDAEALKTRAQACIREAMAQAEELQKQAVLEIATATAAGDGAAISDETINKAQGFSLVGTRVVRKWRFVEGKGIADLAKVRPDLLVVNKGMMDGLLRMFEGAIGDATGGCIEMYEETTAAASKVSS